MTEESPGELFVIVAKDASPIVKWNMKLGRITSAGLAHAQQNPQAYAALQDEWLPWIPNPNYKGDIGFHTLRVSSDMRAEYNAELTRLRHFKHLPSRLACLYAWGSLDDAVRAKETMKGRFNGTILLCRPGLTLRSARCNSALVNFAQRGERRGFFTDEASVHRVWDSYWSGSGELHRLERQNLLEPSGPPEALEMSEEPLWEWLIDGALDILDDVTPAKISRKTAP
jgi:hypothetical protein